MVTGTTAPNTMLLTNTIAKFNAVVENLMSTRVAQLSTLLDTRRDIDNECGYIENPTPTDFKNMFNKEGIARRVVNVWPRESWQLCPVVYETTEPDETEFEQAWLDLVEKHNLMSIMAHADGLSGIGRFAIILLGVSGPENLDQELKPGKKRELLYTRVFDESVTVIDSIDNNPKSPRFGRPVTYSVTFQEDGGVASSSFNQKIHWTHCIHVADNRQMSLVYGESRMRPVFNRLQDIRKLLGGSAEMFWQGAFPGLSFEVDPKALEAGAQIDIDEDALKEQMQNYVNGLQRWLSSTGMSVKSLAPQVADPSNHVECQLRNIALALDIPYRVFLGTEEAKLAASQDSKTWAKRVNGRQRTYLTPDVVRPFIDLCVMLGILPKPTKTLHIEWPDMLTLSDQEKADVAKAKTTAMKDYVQGDVELLIPRKQYLMEVLGFSSEQTDRIIEDSDEVKVERDKEQITLMKQEAAIAAANRPKPVARS